MRAYGALYKGAGINIMNLQLDFGFKDVLALCAGGVILMKPKLSNYIVAIHLIVLGAIGVWYSQHIMPGIATLVILGRIINGKKLCVHFLRSRLHPVPCST